MGRQVVDKYLLSDEGGTQEPPGVQIKVGRDLSTDESVTVEIWDTTTFSFVHGGVQELLKFQVSTMSRLDHPNVVRLVDVLASTSKIFMVMEAVPRGRGLHEAIAISGRCTRNPCRLSYPHACLVIMRTPPVGSFDTE